MQRSAVLPYLAFATCALIWGSTFLAIRISNEALPPLWASTLRLVLAGLILSAILLVSREALPKGKGAKVAVIYGILTFGINFPLLYWGQVAIPSGMAAVMYATCPISSLLFARAYGMEWLDARKMGAAVLALAGVSIIFWQEFVGGVDPIRIGAVLSAATVSTWGATILKRGPKFTAISTNALAAFAGAPLCLGASLLASEPRIVPSTSAQILPLLYLTIAGSVIAFVLFSWLLKHWSVSSSSFIAVVIPVVAVFLGALVRQENFSAGSIVGAIVVLSATAIAIWPSAKAP